MMQTQAIPWEFNLRSPRKTTSKVKELGSGIHDLPADVAVVVEKNLAQSQAELTSVPSESTATVAELVERLTTIRERIWRLRALFAVTLSHDTAIEANQYVKLFQSLGAELQAKDAAEFAKLTTGHEALLMSPPVTVRPTIPLATQLWCEMRWEAAQQRSTRPIRNIGPDTIHDGMGQFL
jgi:hypothetical protein